MYFHNSRVLSKKYNKFGLGYKEYKDILNNIKAQKILIVYPDILSKQVSAYKKSDKIEYSKQKNINFALQDKYKEYSGETFPNFLGEFMVLSEKRKKRSRERQKFE